MGKLVCELVQWKFKEAWYALSKDDRDEIRTKTMGLNEKAGTKTVINCGSMCSSGRWLTFMVKEYPSVETLQQHYRDLHEIDWWRYIEAETTLGTRLGGEGTET